MQRTLIVLLVVICLFSVEAKFLDRVKALFRKLRRRKGSVKTEEMQAATATAPTVSVPIIDIGDLRGGTDAQRMEVAKKIGKAAEDIGFFVITNHGISTEVQDNMWKYTTEFFDTTVEEKMALEPQDQAVYPFGYSKFKGEVLSAGKATESKDGSAVKAEAPPDLKEMFSLGPANPDAGFPPREWPSNPAPFAAAYTAYYDSMADLASTILKSFALVLDLPSEDYFEQFITHHASALRALNYPHVDEAPVPGQLRASAHTDYGTITILKADAPGLQVSKDKDPPSWVDVPYVEGAFIVNLGDLMKRWTNDRWLSTLHRVVNPDTGDACWNGGSTRRQSVAFFHNLNRDAVVENLAKGEPAKYQPIVAGDFLMQKHLAATQGQ
jgi:isopenicillin N synthase-like dioxygenase